MALIYLAAPYTKGDVAQNVHNVIKVADMLLEMGHIPFVPHLTHFWHCVSPKPWDVWLKIDKEVLRRCDAVLRVTGDSKGADLEVEYAKEIKLPVYYNIYDLPKGVTS